MSHSFVFGMLYQGANRYGTDTTVIALGTRRTTTTTATAKTTTTTTGRLDDDGYAQCSREICDE